MRIKMKSIMAGPQGVYDVGAIVDLPKDQAAALVAGGYATVVDATVLHASETQAAARALEAAALEPEEETAAMPAAGKRRRAN